MYHCEQCDYTTERLYDLKKHTQTKKHILRCLDDVAESKPPEHVYDCKVCDFSTTVYTEYVKHCETGFHSSYSEDKRPQCCYCGMQYSAQSNLLKHRKRCKQKNVVVQERTKEKMSEETTEVRSLTEPTNEFRYHTTDALLEFIKQSTEIQNVLIEQNEKLLQKTEEQSKQIQELAKNQALATTTNHNYTTTNNSQFNIQVFLQEKCKDALNITEFLSSLQLQVSDLEKTGELGYVNGITRIFVNALRKLDLYKRPFHCTDIKRETLYVKDQDKWEKDNDEKTKLKHVVNRIGTMNFRQIKQWQEQNPEYEDLDSIVNDVYIKLSTIAMGAAYEEGERCTEKIMRNVMKEVVLDKAVK